MRSRLSLRHLVLCRLEVVDAPALAEALAASREGLAELPWLVEASADPVAWIVRLGERFDLGGSWTFGIFAPDGALLGAASLELTGRNGACLGYWIHAAHRRRGYATEAAGALVEIAFDELGLGRVEAEIAPANVASAAVARHLGLAQGDGSSWSLTRTGASMDRDDDEAWQALVGRVRERYTLLRDEPERFHMAWEFPTPEGVPRQKLVVAERVRRHGRSFVLITARVGSEARWAARAALERGASLAAGALAIVERSLVVRASLPLRGLQLEALALSLEVVAYEALTLALDGPGPTPVFDNLYP